MAKISSYGNGNAPSSGGLFPQAKNGSTSLGSNSFSNSGLDIGTQTTGRAQTFGNNSNDNSMMQIVQMLTQVVASLMSMLGGNASQNGKTSQPQMEISVNGNIVNSSLSFPNIGEWTSWSTVSINANLNNGHNTTKVKSADDSGEPNLDKITIGATSNTPQPTIEHTTPPPSNAIYAAPNGCSSNGGTCFSDALDIETALEKVSAGQTLLLQAGTYNISYSGIKNTIFLTKSGSSSNPINIEGYNGQAILDFSAPEGEWTQDSWGLEVSGDYYYFKNIDITRAAYQGAYVMGSHNTFEECNFYNNRNTGLEINKGGEYTTVINCDAYDNYDPKKNGGMADGFAAKQEQGQGNKFIGCNAWGNSDDGYDNYDSSYVVTYENCTANSNGTYDGNGNGFKLGGNNVTAEHVLTNCEANNNRKHGFHANSNPGPITLINCSASGNGENDFHGDFIIS